MAKSEYPALRMRVENGRLVPASQFDQERLDSYRQGAVVMVKFTEERDRVLIKKWFAVIGLVLKQCKTPWKNKDEAHEAIKLALGIVNLSKTISGQFMQYPKSLSDLDDPEMTEALENMIALLSRMTGVDVDTLRKETAHVDTDNNSEGVSPSSSDAGDVSPSSDSAGASEPPLADAPVSDNCADLLMSYAREIIGAAGTGAAGNKIAEIKAKWDKELEGFPSDVMENFGHITAEARRVFKGTTSPSDAMDNIAGLIGVDDSNTGETQ